MFYTVVRKLFKGGKETHSMEDKETYDEAEKRFLNAYDIDGQRVEPGPVIL